MFKVITTSLVGRTFGKWFVFAEAPRRYRNRHSWVRCSCGFEGIVSDNNLKRGLSTGCIKCANKPSIHGHARRKYKSRVYMIWNGIKKRCLNQNCANFKNYGGRGIHICEEWKSFEKFAAFMGPGKKGWSIERLDNDDGYYPHNVVWATRIKQARNTRTNAVFTVKGIRACLSELCEHFGLQNDYDAIKARIYLGWNIEKALFHPIRRFRSKGNFKDELKPI